MALVADHDRNTPPTFLQDDYGFDRTDLGGMPIPEMEIAGRVLRGALICNVRNSQNRGWRRSYETPLQGPPFVTSTGDWQEMGVPLS